jgi:hypothetical protein
MGKKKEEMLDEQNAWMANAKYKIMQTKHLHRKYKIHSEMQKNPNYKEFTGCLDSAAFAILNMTVIVR